MEVQGVINQQVENQLKKHDDVLSTMRDCTVRLTQIIENHEIKLKDYEERLRLIENKPKVYWDKIISVSISSIVGFLISFMIGGKV